LPWERLLLKNREENQETMPIYKIQRRGAKERQERRLRAWVQWLALLISGLLLSVAALLLKHGASIKH
jgi:hypothetical protein